MTQESFNNQKQAIQARILTAIENFKGREYELFSLKEIFKVMSEYTYANRLEKKGLVTRVIIDSLELDYNISDEILKFDESIS